ncbi:hypothetical protein ES702_05900 [subsurface metagenome]
MNKKTLKKFKKETRLRCPYCNDVIYINCPNCNNEICARPKESFPDFEEENAFVFDGHIKEVVKILIKRHDFWYFCDECLGLAYGNFDSSYKCIRSEHERHR